MDAHEANKRPAKRNRLIMNYDAKSFAFSAIGLQAKNMCPPRRRRHRRTLASREQLAEL